jgi:hypothetical protein
MISAHESPVRYQFHKSQITKSQNRSPACLVMTGHWDTSFGSGWAHVDLQLKGVNAQFARYRATPEAYVPRQTSMTVKAMTP